MKYINQLQEAKKYAREKNRNEIRQSIDEKWVLEKIENFLDRQNLYGSYTVDDIKIRILNDDLVASFFAKDPVKQNLVEQIIKETIEQQLLGKLVKRVIKLPASGGNAKFIVKGELVSASAFHNRGNARSKSVDYFIELINGLQVYVSQKYTEGSGGAQDNQAKEIEKFLTNAAGDNSGADGAPRFFAIALVDGDYWSKKRITALKNICNSWQFVANEETFEDVLTKIATIRNAH